MNLLFENMICAETPFRRCRIWRQMNYDEKSNSEVRDYALVLLYMKTETHTDIVKKIVEVFDDVNSVEVIDKDTGCGICVHKDWP